MSWLAIKLFLGGALKRLSGLFAWITASATRMLAIALCVALLGGIWAYRALGKERASHKADNAACAEAVKIDRASIARLQDALNQQNAAVQALGDASAAKQKQSAKIVADAVERGKTAEAAALRIEQERKTWPRGGPVCRTGEAVMSARNEL